MVFLCCVWIILQRSWQSRAVSCQSHGIKHGWVLIKSRRIREACRNLQELLLGRPEQPPGRWGSKRAGCWTRSLAALLNGEEAGGMNNGGGSPPDAERPAGAEPLYSGDHPQRNRPDRPFGSCRTSLPTAEARSRSTPAAACRIFIFYSVFWAASSTWVLPAVHWFASWTLNQVLHNWTLLFSPPLGFLH